VLHTFRRAFVADTRHAVSPRLLQARRRRQNPDANVGRWLVAHAINRLAGAHTYPSTVCAATLLGYRDAEWSWTTVAFPQWPLVEALRPGASGGRSDDVAYSFTPTQGRNRRAWSSFVDNYRHRPPELRALSPYVYAMWFKVRDALLDRQIVERATGTGTALRPMLAQVAVISGCCNVASNAMHRCGSSQARLSAQPSLPTGTGASFVCDSHVHATTSTSYSANVVLARPPAAQRRQRRRTRQVRGVCSGNFGAT